MRAFDAKEYRVVSLRECPLPAEMTLCDQPSLAAAYWRQHVVRHAAFNPDVECFVVLLLNTRRRVKGHHLVSLGTMDTVLVHPREVFRTAIIAGASAVILMHHPSGEPQPSEADNRRLVRCVSTCHRMRCLWIEGDTARNAASYRRVSRLASVRT